jgi:hypothetical protein
MQFVDVFIFRTCERRIEFTVLKTSKNRDGHPLMLHADPIAVMPRDEITERTQLKGRIHAAEKPSRSHCGFTVERRLANACSRGG